MARSCKITDITSQDWEVWWENLLNSNLLRKILSKVYKKIMYLMKLEKCKKMKSNSSLWYSILMIRIKISKSRLARSRRRDKRTLRRSTRGRTAMERSLLISSTETRLSLQSGCRRKDYLMTYSSGRKSLQRRTVDWTGCISWTTSLNRMTTPRKRRAREERVLKGSRSHH